MLRNITTMSRGASRSAVVISAIDSRTGESVHAFYYSPHTLEHLHSFFGDCITRANTPIRIANHYYPAVILRIVDSQEFDEAEAQ